MEEGFISAHGLRESFYHGRNLMLGGGFLPVSACGWTLHVTSEGNEKQILVIRADLYTSCLAFQWLTSSSKISPTKILQPHQMAQCFSDQVFKPTSLCGIVHIQNTTCSKIILTVCHFSESAMKWGGKVMHEYATAFDLLTGGKAPLRGEERAGLGRREQLLVISNFTNHSSRWYPCLQVG